MADRTSTTYETISGERLDYARKLTLTVYVLQAIGLFIGITYIAAAVVNYVKWNDVRGTWLDSHFRWQIRTFWYSLLFGVIGAITYFILIGYFILFATGIWVIYRIVKGLLYLRDGKEMYPVTGPSVSP